MKQINMGRDSIGYYRIKTAINNTLVPPLISSREAFRTVKPLLDFANGQKFGSIANMGHVIERGRE